MVSGRGLLLGTALETALKLEETCLRPVRGYSYADLRHGPISVVTRGIAAVLVAAPDGPAGSAPMTELADDLAARGATVVGIGGDGAFADGVRRARARSRPARAARAAWCRSSRRSCDRGAGPSLGLDPDNPRGLAKVTQTDRD